MPDKQLILIVDDNAVNRAVLSNILAKDYAVITAENGKDALAVLAEHKDNISAVMLDIIMPEMDGYAFLERIKSDAAYNNLPIIVTTENSGNKNEIKALKLGAWDFVSKPYDAEIIKFRLKNTIDRSQLSALKRLQYLAEYDALTGVFTKAKFFEATRRMIDTNPKVQYVLFRFDIDRFQLINSYFGTDEGDRLLIFIAKSLGRAADLMEHRTYGRMESDIFCFCMPYDEKLTKILLQFAKHELWAYNKNYDIVPSIGAFLIDDNSLPVETMYNRATMAAKTCKGNYIDFYAFYTKEMGVALEREQEIVNEMNIALETEQFVIYLQPQYNIHANTICGAEALVRWAHPQKGMIMPGEFIPVFERNGFITKLDFYVWESVCKYIVDCLAKGKNVHPISVNVSRVNLYNPRLAEILIDLVEKYKVPIELFNLELTESAYIDNPVAMSGTIAQLQEYGFIILMDDFGSGYSSLSVLKDIAVNILKIDMRFLSKSKIAGRGENIIASVIRMAKWLNIPVIAEGAETQEQIDVLRSVGCDYVQGFYYAKPMPFAEYDELCKHEAYAKTGILASQETIYNYDDLFASDPAMSVSFDNAPQAQVLYEMQNGKHEIIRVNNAYYTMFGHDDITTRTPDTIDIVYEEYREKITNAFMECINSRGTSQCEYMRKNINNKPVWVHADYRFITQIGEKYIIGGELADITIRKEIDNELQRYRTSLLAHDSTAHTILIIDDGAINRTILKKIFQDKFNFLEAANGAEAMTIIKKQKDCIDLILLDIIMPKMGGVEFLRRKKDMPELDSIPVIIATAEDSTEQQINTLALGANDYITKPFVPEIVLRRVKNVLESNRMFREMIKEYNDISQQAKTDLMTGLLNRVSAEEKIESILHNTPGQCAMMMLDIDNFKKLNDTFGHSYGDKVVGVVGEHLRNFFRKQDVVARMGGDEFAVFMSNIPSEEMAEAKAHALCQDIALAEIDGESRVTCSVGVAVTTGENHSFGTLYRKADEALYNAKRKGRCNVSVYGKAKDESPKEEAQNENK